MSFHRLRVTTLCLFSMCCGAVGMTGVVRGQNTAAAVPTARPLAPLKSVKVPLPSNLDDFVADRAAAVALGKALFWDIQAGSDGMTACATCHWHAGSDARLQNTYGLPKDNPHSLKLRSAVSKLTESTFPLVRVDDPKSSDDNVSPNAVVVENVQEIVGSKGVVKKGFSGVVPYSAYEKGWLIWDNDFNAYGQNIRTVTSRNTPSVINAVFNHRNNWDGKASFYFNGVNPYGKYDPNAKVLKANYYYKNWYDAYLDSLTGTRSRAVYWNEPVSIALDNASLASQSMGPPPASEMGWVDRPFPALGRKLFTLRPLGQQEVYFTDSCLSDYRHWTGRGLWINYNDLIRKAFKSQWWESRTLNWDGYTQMESNFGMFWGISLMMYQSTLVSDDTPVDRFLAGDKTALTPLAQTGMAIFTGNLVPGQAPIASCNVCHSGPETSSATIGEIVQADGSHKPVQIMLRGTQFDIPTFYDRGFYNIGVQPTANDVGAGHKDDKGFLSLTLRARAGQNVEQKSFDAPINALPVAIDGTFKTPQLRNVELTGPYNHNGGQLFIEQVIEHYARGADFRKENAATLDQGVSGIPALQDRSRGGVEALAAFLRSLTDERVRNQAAPFDHPALPLPDGIVSVVGSTVIEKITMFPAVGRYGVRAGYWGTLTGTPLKPFHEILRDAAK